MALLGIDLGTSSVKVIVLDAQGCVLSTGKADYQVLSHHPGWAEGDPDEWWQATISATTEALERVPGIEISGIGLSGQMHGVILTDAQGMPVRPALLWADERAREQLRKYQALPPTMRKGLANPLVPGMAGPLLLWIKEFEHSLYERAHRALQPKDWLRWRMTGCFATDPTDASATLLYDLSRDGWSEHVISALALKPRLFPEILRSSEMAGRLTQEAAQALHLPVDLPVATGAADTAAAALGTGLHIPGTTQLTLGTGMQLTQPVIAPRADPALRTHIYRAVDSQGWYRMAAVQNGGLALDWTCRTLGANWQDLYESVVKIVPGSEGLIFLPYITQERPHNSSANEGGSFIGLKINHQRDHLLHAALEGVAFGIRIALEALPQSNGVGALRIAGGGSIDHGWLQMLSNILNRELLSVDAPVASARGAALLGGIAAGIWPDVSATLSFTPQPHLTVTPQPEVVALYNALYPRYTRLTEALSKL